MDKKFIEQQKQVLEAKKQEIENKLQGFAKKNKNVEGDWITKYPKFDGGRMEEEAEEVEEYDSLLSISYTLEKELKKITDALERMKKNKYGVCAKCKKNISKGRLKVYPQANYCVKCQ